MTKKCTGRAADAGAGPVGSVGWHNRFMTTGSLRHEYSEDDASLSAAVQAELRRLRSGHGQLEVTRFAECSALRRVCGGNDLLDAYLMFEREMKRYATGPNRDQAAAALSIIAAADTVLDRLEYAAITLSPDDHYRDQRTARRWSDAGLPQIATDLVHLARVQGRLGRELLHIEVAGDAEQGLLLTIDQLTAADLPVTAPYVRLWRYHENEPVEATTAELQLAATSATVLERAEHRMARYRLHVQLPNTVRRILAARGTVSRLRDVPDALAPGLTRSKHDQTLYAISIEGRDAPMRTTSWTDRTQLQPTAHLHLMSYRTAAMLEVVQAAPVAQPATNAS